MSPVLAIPLFVASLAVTLLAARFFAQRLDSIGTRFGLPEAMIGLLTAVAADGPEISSAMVALVKGAHSTSVGVLVGSNAFNLAAMIGVSALLTGCVALSRRDLAPEGAMCVVVTVLGAAVLLRWLSPVTGVVLTVAAVIPYALWLRNAERHALAGHPKAVPSTRATHHLLGLIVVDVALIVGGSFGMVESALSLGHRWGVSEALLGVLILGPLTASRTPPRPSGSGSSAAPPRWSARPSTPTRSTSASARSSPRCSSRCRIRPERGSWRRPGWLQ